MLTNQLLLDGPMKGLSELKLLKDLDIVVPNSFLSLSTMLSSTSDGLKSKAINAEEEKLK